MATELLLLQAIPSCHAFPATPKLKTMVLPNTGLSATNLRIKINRFGGYPFRAAASGDVRTTSQIKEDIYQAIQGINRGIFGVPSAKKSEIEGLVKLLESQNPITDPTQYLDKVGGCWKLVYSTISILGSKRTKLGLRDFITLGDFLQTIDVAKGKAINVIKFNARGLKMLTGELTIEASFKIVSRSRVDITYENSTITPDQLLNVFQKNYELLLGIFNPEGSLEISYVDETMRTGRDDKGNMFILERPKQNQGL